MNISYKNLKLAAVIYAALPIIIFFIGWLNIISSVLFSVMLIAALLFFKNASDPDADCKSITISLKAVIAAAVISLLWCFIAGQGQFVHQSSDHGIRNAIFRDLIAKPWPVTYDNGNTMLSYYIGHWILPAFLGKIIFTITGSTFAGYLFGNIFLLLWSSLGCFIVFLLLAVITYNGKRPKIFTAIFIFIFFSGLDIAGTVIMHKTGIIGASHVEWWAGYFQFSSNSTCLFWVYNQTIVPWMLVLCLIHEKKIHNLALIGILILPYGPFPFVGAVVLCVLKALAVIYQKIKERKITAALKDIFSFQNILSLLAVAPVYILYYSANMIIEGVSIPAGAGASAGTGADTLINTAASTGFRIHSSLTSALASGDARSLRTFLYFYIMFILFEVLLYVFIIIKRNLKDFVFIGMVISLFFIPLFQLGYSSDFAMRVSIPALIYICVMFIKVVLDEIPDWAELSRFTGFEDFIKHKKLLAAALIIFMLGAFTPVTEFNRELGLTISTPYSKIMDYRTNESLESYSGKDNFAAANYQKSNFYKYICKK